MILRRFFSSFCVLAVFLASLSFPFYADALTVSPVKLELKGDPGATVGGSFQLINEQEQTLTFYVSFANFEAEGESGTPKFVDDGTELASWIHLVPNDLNTVTLEPGDSQEVYYEVNIPEDAASGGHFAAIFWGTSPESQEEGQSLALGAKVGILLFLTVNGDFDESADLLEFSTVDQQTFFNELPVSFYYRFQNGGGDRVVPIGEVKIKNTLGFLTEELPANAAESNVLPLSVRRFDIAWGDDNAQTPAGFWGHVKFQWHNFALGYYRAQLGVTYGSHGTEATSGTVAFWVFPWQLVSVVTLSGLLALLFFTVVIRRYNRWIIAQAVAAQRQSLNKPRAPRSPKKK